MLYRLPAAFFPIAAAPLRLSLRQTTRAMRPNLPSIALVGLLSLAGCAHRTGTQHQSAAANATTAPHQLAERATHTRMLQIYVEAIVHSQQTPAAPDIRHANAVAISLRDEMHQRGYDVRGSEPSMPANGAGTQPGELARAIGTGVTPPPFARAVTYLHPNAPRLMLFVHVDEAPATASGPNAVRPAITLGAFIADSSDGAILWSNRVTARPPATDTQLRQLATQLLKTVPELPPA